MTDNPKIVKTKDPNIKHKTILWTSDTEDIIELTLSLNIDINGLEKYTNKEDRHRHMIHGIYNKHGAEGWLGPLQISIIDNIKKKNKIKENSKNSKKNNKNRKKKTNSLAKNNIKKNQEIKIESEIKPESEIKIESEIISESEIKPGSDIKIDPEIKPEPELFKDTIIIKSIDYYMNDNIVNTINTLNMDNASELCDNTLSEEFYNDLECKISSIYDVKNINNNRSRVAQVFHPTKLQQKENAEIPTPPECCDEMLDTISSGFWIKPRKVFEPCCGKGNFVLAIFDRFFTSLIHIENIVDRCRIIIEECIYYTDMEQSNIAITTGLLIRHSKSYLNTDEFVKLSEESYMIDEFKYNSNIGDTLKLDINDKWVIEGFDAIIGNPPYNKLNKDGKTIQGKNKLYCDFLKMDLNRLNTNGVLLYVTPSSWITGSMSIYNYIVDSFTIEYINLHDIRETYFPHIGYELCYYLIKNIKNTLNNTTIKDINGNEFSYMFKNKKERKLFPVKFTEYNVSLLDKILDKSNNGFKYVRDIPDNLINKNDIINESNELYKYIIREGKSSALNKYTNKYIEQLYNKKFVIYEICSKIDCKYYSDNIYSGNHTFYLNILNDKYGILLEKWFNSDLFNNLYNICKSSQYIKSGLIRYIKLPDEAYVENLDINDIDINKLQLEFYKL